MSKASYFEEFIPPLAADDSPDEFYFESSSYALLLNKDYQKLVRALVQLESQKIQAIKDLEVLSENKKNILKDPLSFVYSLQKGECFNFPSPLNVHQVPDIDWSCYRTDDFVGPIRPNTRCLRKETQPNSGSQLNANCEPKKERVHKHTWSAEEQRKLEELLIKYPDEKIARRRWMKISQELGTRTLSQVQSHIQKYFLFLKNNGLPIPGKDPKVSRQWKKKLFQPVNSSFVKAYDFDSEVDSKLPLFNDFSEKGTTTKNEDEDLSEEEDIVEELRDTDEYRKLMQLKRVKKLKQREIESGVVVHHGHKCNGCSANPIMGMRWNCLDCPQEPGVDLCSLCVRNYKDEEHLSSHILKPIKAYSLNEACSSL